jgi:hypothetical protein
MVYPSGKMSGNMVPVWVLPERREALFDIKCEQRLHSMDQVIIYLLERAHQNGSIPSEKEAAHV